MSTRIEPLLANAFIVGIFSALVIEYIIFRGQAKKEERHEEDEERKIEETMQLRRERIAR